MTRPLIWLLGRNGGAEEPKNLSLGLLILRVSIGLMMMLGHGLGKLTGYSEMAAQFPDPYGLGGQLSMGLAVFAEFFCSLGIVFGFLTRAAVVPLIVTMVTAVLIIHGDDPWGKKELAVLYLVPLVTIFVAGPGRYSLDRILWWRWTDRRRR
jgi:putative oxidoreductase